jgi:hypothetical protein
LLEKRVEKLIEYSLNVLFKFNDAYPENCVLLHCVVAISFVFEAAKGCVVIVGTLVPPIFAC